MNRDRYRLVFSSARGQWMAVAEFASDSRTGPEVDGSSTRSRRRRAALSGLIVASFALSPGAWPSAWAQPLPQGGVVVGGQAQISQGAPNQLTITQQSSRSVIDWRSFSIGSGHSVQFVQPGANAQTLNRVIGTDASQIQGLLSANGQIFLVNPNGIVFGQGAVVDVGGLIATTRDIPSAAFMAGCQSLALAPTDNATRSGVDNQGSIRAIRGYVVLQGAQVRNSGSIVADGGTIALAAGDRATVALSNGQLVSVTLDAAAADALVQSSGLIQAQGGQVLLTSRSADAVLSNAINLTGVVDVSAPIAGSVGWTPSSIGGRVTVDGGEAGVTHLSGARVDASSTTDAGGAITVTGDRVALIEGTHLDARGATAGGSVKIGGGWQGNDATVRNARMTVLDETSRIDASATDQGRGGSVVLWSNEYTGFHGNIAAAGGPNGGDGGSVETSSHDNLQAFGRVNASAPNGNPGHWLLDPTNVTISSATSTNATVSGGLWAVTNATATISNGSINADLNAGTSVTVTTASAGTGTGHLNVNADIVKTAGPNASLTLLAEGNLTLNANLTSTSNALNVSLTSPRTLTFANTTIDLNGGTLTANGGSASGTVYGIEFKGNSVFAGDRDTVLLDGIAHSAPGVRLSSGSIVQSGNGSMSIRGTGNTGIGAQLSSSTAALIQSGSGILSISGVSDSTYGIAVGGSAIRQTGDGTLNITGVSNGREGVSVSSSATLDQSGNGMLSITGVSNTSCGTIFNVMTFTQSGAGQAHLTGISAERIGLNIVNGTINQTGSGSLTMRGEGNVSVGVQLGSNARILQSGDGVLRVDGTSTSGCGTASSGASVNQTGSGELLISGTSSSGRGLFLSNMTVEQAGIGNLSLSGTSVTANGTNIAGGNLTQTGNGTLRISGESASVAGVQFYSGTALTQAASGRIEVTGSGNASQGIETRSLVIDQSGNGSLSFTGTSNVGYGIYLIGSNVSTRADGGIVKFEGSAQSGRGIHITTSTIDQAGNGSLTITGNGTTGVGAGFSATQFLQSANGTMDVAGFSDSGRGLEVTATSTINQTGSGVIMLNGRSAGDGTGLSVTSSTLAQSDRGTLTAIGTSNTGCGTSSGTMNIVQSGEGQFDLIGASNSSYGVSLTTGTINQSGAGNLTVNGSSQSGGGIWFNNGKTLQSGTGRLLISGQSDGSAGIQLVANSSVTQAGQGRIQVAGIGGAGTGVAFSRAIADQQGDGILSIAGTSATGLGTQFTAASRVLQSGNGTLDIAGISNQFRGMDFSSGAQVIQSGDGSMSLFGQSPNTTGLALINDNTAVAQSGRGSLTLTGITQSSAWGIWIANTTISQSGDGQLDLSGSSDSGRGILADSSIIAQTGGGHLSATGIAQSGIGTSIRLSTLQQSGPGAFSLNGTSASGQGLWIREGNNVTVGNASFLSAGGGINASGPLNVSGTLVLNASGSNADILALDPTNNISGTVTVTQGRSVSLINAGALNLSAIDAGGDVVVSTRVGDLLVNGNIASSAGNVTLMAGATAPDGTLVIDPYGDVRRGSGQSISAGPGRTAAIYSGNPDTLGPSGLGSLVAATSDGTTGVNKYYATNASAGPGTGQIDTASPLNLFYRVRPGTLVLTGDGATKIYGADDPDFRWTATGFIDGDTATSLGLRGNLGRSRGEGIGDYTLTPGSIQSRGYDLGVQGHLSIIPANLSVSAQDASKVQGQPDPVFTHVANGVIDRVVQSVGPDGIRRGVAIQDDGPALMGGSLSRAPGESLGTYEINAGSLHLVNANYTLSPASVTPATLTIVAAPAIPTDPIEPENPLQRLSGALGFVLPIARLGWPGDVDPTVASRPDPLEYGAWRAVNPPLAESSATPAQAAAWTQALPSGANVIRLPIVVASPSAAAPSISDPYRNTDGPRAVGPTAAPVAVLQLHVDVLFQFGRSDVEGMLPVARADLDRFIDRLAAQGLAIDAVTIDGHADRLGSEQANQRISQRRAETVMRYLRQRGLTARMGKQAHGSSEPLARCGDHMGSALTACLQPNRRASVQAH